MASTNSTVDGMGGEEASQTGSTVTNLWAVGSVVAEEHISARNHFITTGSIYGGDGTFTGSVQDRDGYLRSTKAQVGNATVLPGYRVQAGSVTTANSNSGLIVFADPYSTEHWFMTISPRALSNPYLYIDDQSGTVPCVSGERRASGCWVVGGSKTVFDWIAVGL